MDNIICGFLTSMQGAKCGRGRGKIRLSEDGVGSAAVLGSLLFLIHINELPSHVRSQVRLFAEDCPLYRQIKSEEDQEILQQDPNNLGQWADTWGMVFNLSKLKCNIQRITRNRKPWTKFYTLCGQILKQGDQVKYRSRH